MPATRASTSRVVNEYLERNGVWKLMRSMMRAVTVATPDDPLTFLVNFLQRYPSRPRVLVLAPSHAQARQRCEWLHEKLGLVFIDAVAKDLGKGDTPGTADVVLAVEERVKECDCLTHGFAMCGFPRNELEARSLLAHQISFTRVIVLEDSESVEVDENTNRVALVFRNRLTTLDSKMEPTASENRILAAAVDIASNSYRDPQLPARVIVLGGSERVRSAQAKALAKSLDLEYLKLEDLIARHVDRRTKLGEEILDEQRRRRQRRNKPLSDSIIVQVVIDQVSNNEVDARGWVLDGFPTNSTQALLLRSAAGKCYEPNRAVLVNDDDNVVPLDLAEFYKDISLEIDCLKLTLDDSPSPMALHEKIVSFVAEPLRKGEYVE